MSRWRALRPLGFLLGIWSVLLAGEPSWLHSCPAASASSRVVSLGVTPERALTSSAPAHHHAPEGAIGGAMESHAPITTDDEHSHSESGCECVGVCACTAVPAKLNACVAHVPAPALVLDATSRFIDADVVPSRLHVKALLPWPTAPPAIS